MAKTKTSKAVQTIDQLQSRYQAFSEQKIKVQTQCDHLRQELAKLQAEAQEQFGSDDLETLQKMLVEMKQSNQQKRIDYQQQLDQIEQRLNEIDEQFVETEIDEDLG